MKIDFTTEAVTCRPSDSALPPTFMPSTEAIMPMIMRHERRLDQADAEMVLSVDGVAQPVDEGGRRDAGIDPGDQRCRRQARRNWR